VFIEHYLLCEEMFRGALATTLRGSWVLCWFFFWTATEEAKALDCE